MVMLGGFFSLFSQSWLLEADRFITVARVFNTLLDTLAWLLFFDILRRVFSVRRSMWVTLPVFLMPFTFIHGGLAYLDSPGGAFALLGTWFYFARVRQRPSRWNWAILGVLLGAGILVKQSGILLLPILFCLGLIWPPRQEWRPLIPSPLVLLTVVGCTVCAGTDPSGLARGSVESVSSTREFRSNKQATESGFRRLEYLMNAGEHYHFGTGPGRPIPFVGSPLLRRLHQVSFPLLVILFGLSVVVLALRRHWRALPLPVLIAAVAVYIPHGISVRRLYFLLPFALVTMALGWSELRPRSRTEE